MKIERILIWDRPSTGVYPPVIDFIRAFEGMRLDAYDGNLSAIDYQVVIVFREESFLEASEALVDSNVQILLICYASQLQSTFPCTFTRLGGILILADTGLSIGSSVPGEFCTVVQLPLPVVNEIVQIPAKEFPVTILVRVPETFPSLDAKFNFARFVNALCNFDYRLKILNDTNKCLSTSMFDSRIEYYTVASANILDDCEIIVGYGELIAEGLLKQKHCIVVGHYGYGGIISEYNVTEFYSRNFDGRYKGSRYEHIPYALVFDDISEILTADAVLLRTQAEAIRNTLIVISAGMSEKIRMAIFKCLKKSQFLSCVKTDRKFELTGLFSIEKLGNRYYVQNRLTKRLQMELDYRAFDLITLLTSSTSEQRRSDVSSAFDQEAILSVVRELVNENVLKSSC